MTLIDKLGIINQQINYAKASNMTERVEKLKRDRDAVEAEIKEDEERRKSKEHVVD